MSIDFSVAMTLAVRLYRSIHMGRIIPKVDPNLAEQIIDKTINLKTVPMRRNLGLVRLPAQLEAAAQAKIRCVSEPKFREEAKRLTSILYNLKLPDDRNTIKSKKADIKTELEIRDKINNLSSYEPTEVRLKEDCDIARYELSELINGTLEDRRRDWHYYDYDDYASNLYMATRLAPNYASIRTVMSEIHDFDPSFEPKSVLDFGSGMGTTIWAVNETWPDAVREFMNVDLSKHQQYLCEYLLRGGTELGEPLPGIFHRQYLPSSNKVKYDMVVAAYSMLELPNSQLRTQTIENLWQKTNDLLVIIERGNKSGFSIVNEARHFILDLSGHNVTKKINFTTESKPILNRNIPKAHVIAPCSHEFLCPRATMPSKKRMDTCRFRVVYEPLDLGYRKSGYIGEEFSYIVLRKRPHPSYFGESCPRWPRVVEKRNHSRNQITQKLCCPNGNLAETVITAKKYGKPAYQVAKSSDWGDVMPIRIEDTYIRRSFFNDEKSQSDDDKSHE